jgi:hypothetical protein
VASCCEPHSVYRQERKVIHVDQSPKLPRSRGLNDPACHMSSLNTFRQLREAHILGRNDWLYKRHGASRRTSALASCELSLKLGVNSRQAGASKPQSQSLVVSFYHALCICSIQLITQAFQERGPTVPSVNMAQSPVPKVNEHGITLLFEAENPTIESVPHSTALNLPPCPPPKPPSHGFWHR